MVLAAAPRLHKPLWVLPMGKYLLYDPFGRYLLIIPNGPGDSWIGGSIWILETWATMARSLWLTCSLYHAIEQSYLAQHLIEEVNILTMTFLQPDLLLAKTKITMVVYEDEILAFHIFREIRNEVSREALSATTTSTPGKSMTDLIAVSKEFTCIVIYYDDTYDRFVT